MDGATVPFGVFWSGDLCWDSCDVVANFDFDVIDSGSSSLSMPSGIIKSAPFAMLLELSMLGEGSLINDAGVAGENPLLE